MEYRYWAFMEAHPAHAALPFSARREAMEVLTWAWTGACWISFWFGLNLLTVGRRSPTAAPALAAAPALYGR